MSARDHAPAAAACTGITLATPIGRPSADDVARFDAAGCHWSVLDTARRRVDVGLVTLDVAVMDAYLRNGGRALGRYRAVRVGRTS